MRLSGFEAIEYAERECLTLNKRADRIDDQAVGLSVAEAEAIADEDPDLIWLDVSDAEYYGGPHNLEPGTEPTRNHLRAGQRPDELAPSEGRSRRSIRSPSAGEVADESGDNSADILIDRGQADETPLDGFDVPAGETLVEPQSGLSGGAVGGTPAGKRSKPK